jgi:hypothetical protein
MVAAPMAPARRTRLSTVVFAILRNALTVSVGIVLLLLRNSNGQGNSRKNTSGVYIKSQIRTKLSIITHHDLASAPPGMGSNAAFFHDFARYFQSKIFTGTIGFEHFRALWGMRALNFESRRPVRDDHSRSRGIDAPSQGRWRHRM